MHLKKGSFIVLLSSLISQIVFSASENTSDFLKNDQLSKMSSATGKLIERIPNKLKHGHAFVQLGGYWSNQGAEQHININDLIGDQFTVTSSNHGNGLVGFGYLVDGHKYKDYIKMQYGVNAFYLAKTSVRGNVVQENLFTNLSYSYNVTHWPLYAVAKSTITPSFFKHDVTLDVGIGPNFMRLTDFKERPIQANSIPDTIFSNNTSTTFSATVGVGMKLDKAFANIPLECGYRFYYLGKGSFNIDNSQVQNALNTGSAYANALMCSITT